MAAGNVRSGLRFSALIVVILACLASVRAQERESPGHGAFGVPLQPFLAGQSASDSTRPEPMRVAYYAPRAQPTPASRAAAVEEDNDDAEIANAFAIIAGLRLDTTDMRDGDAVGPRWYAEGRDTRRFVARHPAGW